jgi:hypothetical protein
MALDAFLFAQGPLNVRFIAECCDEEDEPFCQFARVMENRVYDLVDSTCFSPLAFLIQKSATVILDKGGAMRSVVQGSHCTIFATCHGASTKFTQKVSTDENAPPYCQVPTLRNVEIDKHGTAWIVSFSMTSRRPCSE